MTITVTPLTGTVGAAVAGVDLNQPLSDADFEPIRRAFLDHCMLVFRGQHLTPAAQVAFAKRWGSTGQQNPLLQSLDGFPEIVQVTKIPKATASTEAWHYDTIYTPTPPALSILSAVIVPHGGDTMWSNQYEAYDRLSETMKRVIEGLRVRFVGLRLGRMLGADMSALPSADHPLVRTHPETGRKALVVGHPETAQCIEGMSKAESRPLLDFLYAHSTSPDNVYRHMWQAGDVVMWDNRCTMHYAVHDYGEAERVLNRVTILGDTPV
ncbi:MAG: TauD/TfdA dioxygenase family protein [Burkholderiaceae bacterium]